MKTFKAVFNTFYLRDALVIILLTHSVLDGRAYYRIHGQLSAGTIFVLIVLGVMIAASLIYGTIFGLRQWSHRRRRLI